jgi:hypothetical protein
LTEEFVYLIQGFVDIGKMEYEVGEDYKNLHQRRDLVTDLHLHRSDRMG